MRFTLIDRITELTPGQSLTAVKNLTMSEDYLQDHFPLFPIMPGVLMVESLYQAGAWLVRCSEDFAHSMVLLSEAKNVKFNDFIEPGQTLVVHTRIQKQDDQRTWLQGEGSVDQRVAVKARLVLERYNLADRQLASEAIDAYMIHQLRHECENLLGHSLAQSAR